MIGRTKEIERVSQILSRRKKNNPLLIGEPGLANQQLLKALHCVLHKRKLHVCYMTKE